MKTIEQIVEEFNKIPRDSRPIELAKYAMTVVNACLKHAESPEAATNDLGVLTCTIFLADDKISEAEFQLLCTSATIALGNETNFADCIAMAQDLLNAKEDLKVAAIEIATRFLSPWSDEDKEALLVYLVGLCAIDEQICAKEINWLKVLMSAAGAYK